MDLKTNYKLGNIYVVVTDYGQDTEKPVYAVPTWKGAYCYIEKHDLKGSADIMALVKDQGSYYLTTDY